MKVLKLVAAAALLAAAGTTSLFIRAAGADTSASPLTPITPCRLIDTRPAPDHVGTLRWSARARERWRRSLLPARTATARSRRTQRASPPT